jgi:hypothetical protein
LDLEKYSRLPDYLPVNELESHFSDLLNYLEESDLNFLEEKSKALLDLVDRQCDTYKLIDKELKIRVESWIKKIWNANSFMLVDNITSIVANLGLEGTFQFIKEELPYVKNKKILKLLEETIDELEGNVQDPYSGMK